MIFWGIIVCGIGHVLIVAGGAKELMDKGTARIPFFLGVYILAIGAGKVFLSFFSLSLKTEFELN
jgi:hypothetical protein